MGCHVGCHCGVQRTEQFRDRPLVDKVHHGKVEACINEFHQPIGGRKRRELYDSARADGIYRVHHVPAQRNGRIKRGDCAGEDFGVVDDAVCFPARTTHLPIGQVHDLRPTEVSIEQSTRHLRLPCPGR